METGVHAIQRSLESAGYSVSVTPLGGGLLLVRLSRNGKTLHRAVGRILCDIFLKLAQEVSARCIHAGHDIKTAGIGPETVQNG